MNTLFGNILIIVSIIIGTINAGWIGTAPSCGGDCTDCTGSTPMCLITASSSSEAPSNYQSGFGSDCVTGYKVYCAPAGTTPVATPRWFGTAPACGGSCSDCSNTPTPVCMATASSSSAAPAYASSFGSTCSSGSKVLCGPPGSTIYPHWVGTAPACGAACTDCKGTTPVCMAVAGSSSTAPAYTNSFGASCTTGHKVLCGPTGSTIFPHWVGTAPACSGDCTDCTGTNTPVCMALSDTSTEAPAHGSTFGASCTSGDKVLCGPSGSTVYPRWIGTAPACGASCSDCYGYSPICMVLASSSTDAPVFKSSFGATCTSGRKALCGPPGSQVFPRWVGTAPACGGSCTDCNDDTPICMAVCGSSSDAPAYSTIFGASCTTGNKVLCGPTGSLVYPRWVGTAPACGGSCTDCNDDSPVCMAVTSSSSKAPAYQNIFGSTCTTGNKVLCGPIGSTIYPRWVGTAPACGASCSDCTGITPVCMVVAGDDSKTPVYNFSFGASCVTGTKVLCGPPGSKVYPRWVGTAPACAGSCSDCNDDSPVCMAITSSSAKAPAYGSIFGSTCTTGDKVLCGPIGSTIYPRWVGTAPACGASCDDCKGITPVCMAVAGDDTKAPAYPTSFGASCTTGVKVLCGPPGSKVYPRWIGTAPACGASCDDCKGAAPVCMTTVGSSDKAPAPYQDSFGATCTTGDKALCGPPGSTVYPRWIGTAPACGASCDDCKLGVPVCMTVASTSAKAPTDYQNTFGATCTTGDKVLCGPNGSTVYPRWMGTAPACGASCDDCKGDTPVCMTISSSSSKAPTGFQDNFGATCTTGSKVLCGPPGSTIYPRWYGTAPACGASCDDCSGDTPVCMAVAGDDSKAPAYQSAFGASCVTGTKALCGPIGSKVYMRWVGTAPACEGECSDCDGDTPVCMAISSSKEDAPSGYGSTFGSSCVTGNKVLCGTNGSKVFPRWIGTAPACAGDCSKDCHGDTPVCMDVSGSGAGSSAVDYTSTFGKDCVTGSKVLCGPPGSSVYPIWIGTAPACDASCDDCPHDRPKCIDSSFFGVWNTKYYSGSMCTSGTKVLCAPDSNTDVNYYGLKIGLLVVVIVLVLGGIVAGIVIGCRKKQMGDAKKSDVFVDMSAVNKAGK